jgi:hypothetical protein
VRAAPLNAQLTAANQEWALDFVTDALASGRGIRILTLREHEQNDMGIFRVVLVPWAIASIP